MVIGGYPDDCRNETPRELIETFLEQFKSAEGDIKTSVREKIARSLAAAGAVNYGETLTPAMMQELVDQLFACESPGYSPSGKLIISILAIEEMERKFK